jgi:cytoskeletal protein RodZ
MDNNTLWIVLAIVAALVVIGALLWFASRQRTRRRAQQADQIREAVHHESAHVERREALAHESAAKARAAEAEAEAKAAEAARLKERADAHRTDAQSSRDRLDEQLQHADALDPRRREDTAGESQAEHMAPDTTGTVQQPPQQRTG